MAPAVHQTKFKSFRPRLGADVPQAAMVLAAGLGTRMAPLTDSRPKAMVQVAGRSLIDRVLDRFAAAGVAEAVVNIHHHADLLESHLSQRSDGPRIAISDERSKLLETGGGVIKALPLLDADPFIVANCDALWLDGLNDTLLLMAHAFDPARMDALLLMVPSVQTLGYDGTGDFVMDAWGQASRKPERTVSAYVYGGVALYSKAAFKGLPSGEAFSLNRVFDNLAEEHRLYGIVHEGRGAHGGTPEALRLAERTLFA